MNVETTESAAVEVQEKEVQEKAAEPCCGTAAEATESNSCCGESAKATAIAAGAGCCG